MTDSDPPFANIPEGDKPQVGDVPQAGDTLRNGDEPLEIDEPLAGVRLIEAKIRTLPNSPGVYRMLDAKGDALYVGKAKSLKKRVPAYTKTKALSQRLKRMVALTRQFDVVTTTNEVEALLLECNMIKRLRPAFNILPVSYTHLTLPTIYSV